mmetsp:Transcript_57661/g.135731  ORF Transcript_57661/g.135731 Transcript_57661/m.135731 type:complete len:231 (+) Transcript_57661:2234-2926(+)
MLAQVEPLGQREDQDQAGHPEDLEVGPGRGREVIGHVQVEHAQRGEEQHPGAVQAQPDEARQLQLGAQHGLDQVLVEAGLRDPQRQGHGPVEAGGLPLDEGLVVEPDGRRAEGDDQHQADPQHQVDLLATQLQDGRLRQRRDHHDQGGQQHRRFLGANDATLHEKAEMLGGECGRRIGMPFGALEDREEEDQWQEIEQQLHGDSDRGDTDPTAWDVGLSDCLPRNRSPPS